MKKRKEDIFFNPIGGSAPLTITWYDGPMGDAVESVNEMGVGFFSPSDDLLGVIFDDVSEQDDEQELTFSNEASVRIKVKDGHVKIVKLTDSKRQDSV